MNMGVQADNLAGEYFITTGSGKFFRNVEPDPSTASALWRSTTRATAGASSGALEGGAKPTVRVPQPLHEPQRPQGCHQWRKPRYLPLPRHQRDRPDLHSALTDRDFTRALWQSATECPVVFPEGVGVCPWMVPGGADIAMATSELMKTYQAAIWAQHGLFASGPDFDITFGLAHTIEKSAEIYVKVLSMGGGIIRQTITDDDLRAIARDFGVTLNEKFLN